MLSSNQANRPPQSKSTRSSLCVFCGCQMYFHPILQCRSRLLLFLSMSLAHISLSIILCEGKTEEPSNWSSYKEFLYLNSNGKWHARLWTFGYIMVQVCWLSFVERSAHGIHIPLSSTRRFTVASDSNEEIVFVTRTRSRMTKNSDKRSKLR